MSSYLCCIVREVAVHCVHVVARKCGVVQIQALPRYEHGTALARGVVLKEGAVVHRGAHIGRNDVQGVGGRIQTAALRCLRV